MQSKKMSLTETITNTGIGLIVSFISNTFIFWYMDMPVTIKENLELMLYFTAVSIVRGYCVRRFFNRLEQTRRKEILKQMSAIDYPCDGE